MRNVSRNRPALRIVTGLARKVNVPSVAIRRGFATAG
jgi:hypothetical protein